MIRHDNRLPFRLFRGWPTARAAARCRALALLMSLSVAACTPQQIEAFNRTVVVQYTLTNRCEDGFVYWVAGDVDPSGVGTRVPTLVYTIDAVANEQPASTRFTLDPSLLFIDPPVTSRVFTGGPSTRVTIPRSGPIVVAPGTTWNGREMVIIALDAGAIPIDPARALRYRSPPDQPVMMVGRPSPSGVRTSTTCTAPDLPAQTILQ